MCASITACTSSGRQSNPRLMSGSLLRRVARCGLCLSTGSDTPQHGLWCGLRLDSGLCDAGVVRPGAAFPHSTHPSGTAAWGPGRVVRADVASIGKGWVAAEF